MPEDKPFSISGETYEGDILGTCAECGRKTRMLLLSYKGKKLCYECWEKKQ